MLVLSRTTGEELIINGNIRVTVVGVSGNRVRLGITAPPEIRIIRKEIEARYPEHSDVTEPGRD